MSQALALGFWTAAAIAVVATGGRAEVWPTLAPELVLERADGYLIEAVGAKYATESYTRLGTSFESVQSDSRGPATMYSVEYEYAPLVRIGATPSHVTVVVQAGWGDKTSGRVVRRGPDGEIIEPRVSREAALDAVATLDIEYFDRMTAGVSILMPHLRPWVWIVRIPHPREPNAMSWTTTSVEVDAVTGEVLSRETSYGVGCD